MNKELSNLFVVKFLIAFNILPALLLIFVISERSKDQSLNKNNAASPIHAKLI